jgi:hypothetical protein
VSGQNAASRLHEILKNISKMPHNRGMRPSWAEVFQVQPENTAEILFFYTEILKMLQNVRERVANLSLGDKSKYLNAIDQLNAGLLIFNLNGNLQSQQGYFTEMNLLTLSVCSDLISMQYETKLVSQELLREIQADIEKLLRLVIEEELPIGLKKMLTEKLQFLHKSVVHYRITGEEGMREALETCTGAIVLNAKTHSDNPLLKKIVETIIKANGVLSYGELSKDMITEPIVKKFLE